METVFEIIFELLVEGSLGAVTDKKVPLALRIAAALFIAAVYGGLVGVLMYMGIRDSEPILLVIAAVILILTAVGIWKTYTSRKK
ncbi:MAG: hypothetical protein IJ251_10025 [Oscillospiraceae bacterium]|nr:hypothetical protein [Oscillospiraceae bacterium]